MKTYYLILAFAVSGLNLHGQSNNCMDFDGIDDYLIIGDTNDLGTTDFTIEAWVNCESTAGVGQFVLCKGLTTVGTPTNAGYGLRTNETNANDVDFLIGGGSSLKVISAVALSTNNWHHIAGVRSGIYMYLYVDGVLVSSDSTSSIFDVTTNIPLSLGAHDKGGLSNTAEFFNGSVDEVRIWNIARSQAEINSDKDCAITSPEDNLIAVYNMNLGAGTVAVDSSGYHNDASFVNNPTWISSSVAPVCAVGVEELTNTQLSVYPNPTSETMSILNTKSRGTYQVIDLTGKVVLSGKLNQPNINVDFLRKGSYALKLEQDNRVLTTKFLIQ